MLLQVDNIHVHYGPVAAVLFTGDPSVNNRFRVSGDVSSADLVGPLEGMNTFDLWREIRNGNAYVNVHTTDHPGGELRADLP